MNINTEEILSTKSRTVNKHLDSINFNFFSNRIQRANQTSTKKITHAEISKKISSDLPELQRLGRNLQSQILIDKVPAERYPQKMKSSNLPRVESWQPQNLRLSMNNRKISNIETSNYQNLKINNDHNSTQQLRLSVPKKIYSSTVLKPISKRSTQVSLNEILETKRTLEEAILQDVINSKFTSAIPHIHQQHQNENFDNARKTQLITKQDEQLEFEGVNFLNGHEIIHQYRAKMIDWMIQVFRVFQESSPPTFFLAISIIDRYLAQKQKQGLKVKKSQFHLLGLAAIYLSSKFEDVRPIGLAQIEYDAGHGKFQKQDIILQEEDIMRTLEFKIQSKTVYEEAFILLKTCFLSYQGIELDQSDKQTLEEYLFFLCQLTQHELVLVTSNVNLLAQALVLMTLKFIKRQSKKLTNKSLLCGRYTPQKLSKHTEKINRYHQIRDFQTFIKKTILNGDIQSNKNVLLLEDEIIQSLTQFRKKHPSLKNLEKSYPNFFCENALTIFQADYMQCKISE